MGIFVFAGIAGLMADLLLGAWLGWAEAHTLAHYCFGVGFPMFWMALFSLERKTTRWHWQVAIDQYFFRRFCDGFWLGVAITAGWSLWNELLVYLVMNPRHGLDWHHWVADQAGIVTGFLIRKRTDTSANSVPSPL